MAVRIAMCKGEHSYWYIILNLSIHPSIKVNRSANRLLGSLPDGPIDAMVAVKWQHFPIRLKITVVA